MKIEQITYRLYDVIYHIGLCQILSNNVIILCAAISGHPQFHMVYESYDHTVYIF